MIIPTLPPAYLSWTLAAVVSFVAFFAIVAAVMVRRPRITGPSPLREVPRIHQELEEFKRAVLDQMAMSMGLPPDCIEHDPPKEYSRAREEHAEHRQRFEAERRKMEQLHERLFGQSSSLLDEPSAE